MNNTFEIIGKLSIAKESEKFKPYTKNTSESGWAFNKLLFNVQSAENRHMLEANGMYKEDGTGIIYSFTKGKVDEKTHEKTKGENIQIPWKDRHKPEVIEKVAEFKKFIIDLEKYGRRYELKNALESQKEGTLNGDELKALGVDDLEKALEESEKKRKEFLSDYEFTEFLYKLISSEKVKDKVFKITGNIVYTEYNGNFYKKLQPTRIYLVKDDEEQTSTGQLAIFFNKDSLDKGSFKDTNKLYVNGYVRNYDNKRKSNLSAPIQIAIDGSKVDDEKVVKFTKIMEGQFTVKDNSWKEFGVKVKLLDGAQKVEITDDLLTDFQKQMLELDAITMDEIRKEIGGDVYGDKVQEMVVINIAKGFTKGRKDTVFVDSDFVNKEIEKPNKTESPVTEDVVFDDLDLDLDI